MYIYGLPSASLEKYHLTKEVQIKVRFIFEFPTAYRSYNLHGLVSELPAGPFSSCANFTGPAASREWIELTWQPITIGRYVGIQKMGRAHHFFIKLCEVVVKGFRSKLSNRTFSFCAYMYSSSKFKSDVISNPALTKHFFFHMDWNKNFAILFCLIHMLSIHQLNHSFLSFVEGNLLSHRPAVQDSKEVIEDKVRNIYY